MVAENINQELVPNREFTNAASDEQIERTAKALASNNIYVLIAENGAEAKRMFFESIPEGAEVYLGASATLETLGIKDEIEKSGRYDALRPKMFTMNRETQMREIRKLASAPDYAAGSVQAVTEDGQVLLASTTGSQLGPYVSGAGKVIWVVGAQKLVKNIEEGLRRINEYGLPLEKERMRQLYNMSVGISVNKILIVNKEARPNRTTMIIVKEEVGY